MPKFINTCKETSKLNVFDICPDFDCLKISVLQKASRVSENLNQVTIGPDSTFSCEFNALENNENTQNSCNIPEAKKSKLPANNVSTRNGIIFSIKKILYENEIQRKELVWKKMEKRRQEMEQSVRASKKEIEIYQSILSVKREQEKKEELARLEAEEERQAQQTELRRRHEQQLLAQRIKEQKEKLERDAEEERKKAKEREEMVKKIQCNFLERWRDFEALTNSCKEKYLIEPYIENINELRAHMETIGNAARSGRLSATDLEFAKKIVQNSEEVLCLFKMEIERINAIHDARIAQREQEVREAEALQAQGYVQVVEVQPEVTAPEPQGIEVTDSGSAQVQEIAPNNLENQAVIELYKLVDRDSLQLYVVSQELLTNYEEIYKEFIHNNENKKFRFECQKTINIPINAISSISKEHLRDKYEKLRFVLSGHLSPDLRADAFCKNTLAKKIINQGEALISSKPEMAFTVAAVAVALWNDSPEFGDLLLANFRTTCPFIVPAFFPQREGQSSEDYYRSLGYKYAEDGTVEKQDKFLKRNSGLMRLYASIIVTKQRQGISKPHPHGLKNAWRWLAAMLNNEPRPEMSDICATLMLDMLEVTGHSLWKSYPRQFPKLLSLMITDYYPMMGIISGIGGGPLIRLEEFLNGCLANRNIAPPRGELPPNFW